MAERHATNLRARTKILYLATPAGDVRVFYIREEGFFANLLDFSWINSACFEKFGDSLYWSWKIVVRELSEGGSFRVRGEESWNGSFREAAECGGISARDLVPREVSPFSHDFYFRLRFWLRSLFIILEGQLCNFESLRNYFSLLNAKGILI